VTRYDWPRAPYSRDDPASRTTHLGRFRPAPDPTSITAAPPRPTGLEFDLPTGNQNLWLPIGPSVTVNGQASGDPNVAGRIRDLQVEPVNGQRVYAASAAGGVWFSPDRGETWRPLDDFATSERDKVGQVASALSCGSVHVVWGGAAEIGTKDDEVWVGTGEPSIFGGRGVSGRGGLPGTKLRGIGFLTATGPAANGTWSVVTADAPPPAVAADSLRGHATYRITGDPADPTQLVAGTTNGLYLRPFGGTWAKVAAWTLTANTHPLDVVMTRSIAKDSVRIWVASTSALFMAEAAVSPGTPIDPALLTFTPILQPVSADPATPADRSRMVLAVSGDGALVYVLGLRKPRASDVASGDPARTTPAACLWSVTALEATPVVTQINGVPLDLFGTQADYDMCVAVHPDVRTRVYVGGSFVKSDGDYNGGIYRMEVSGTTATPTLIGSGVHADDHVIRVGPVAGFSPKRAVWVGCDGGMFCSDKDGDPKTFIARNNGLAVLQAGYVAGHATNCGIVAAGFQDNGTAVRVGDTVWEETFKGDGGGIVYDPSGANRYFRQYIHADWEANDGGVRPVLRRGAWLTASATKLGRKTSETIENDASFFYSGADAVQHGGLTHLAFGTDRVWYSTDWGRNWVTLPSAKDPRGQDNPDLDQDVIYPGAPGTYSDTVGSTECCSSTYTHPFTGGAGASGIVAVKFARTSDATQHTLRVLILYGASLVWLTGHRQPLTGSGAFTWDPLPAAPGSPVTQKFRVPTTPAETSDLHDGKPLTFLPGADLISDVAVHRPDLGSLGSLYVTTIGTDGFPDATGSGDVDTLYFFDGDSTWWPCGLRRETPTTPAANWTLPRVTAPGLGVVVDPDDPSIVFVATSVGVVRGELTTGTDGAGHATYSWKWAQFMNGLPEAAVQDLSIHKSIGPPDVKLLRAALASRGVWEVDLANPLTAPLTYLRVYPSDTRRRVPTPMTGPLVAGEKPAPAWDNSPNIVVDTSGTTLAGPPSEADLYKLAKDQIAGFSGKALVEGRHPVVHVLAHHRSGSAAGGADVRVALMMHAMDGSDPPPLGGLWNALVAAAGSATPPATLPDGWHAAGSSLWQSLAGPVDTRTPRSVSFPLDLSSQADGAVFALVAVVLSKDNLIKAAEDAGSTTVQDLVVRSAHAAAKSIELDTP
jgi:hypothetical protein